MRELNEEQRIAVSHFAGPMLVLAGPGSGKTYTITERIKRLVNEHDVAPGNILVITFTKAAAAEMKQRYLAEGGKGGVQFGTFHAVFFTILKYAYHYSADNIIRDEMKYRILRDLVAESRLEIQDENEFLVDLQLDKTSVQGENGVLTASVQVTNTGKLEGEEVVQLYIGDPAASISRPMKELKNFQKISLKPGESRKVSFTITPEDLKFYNSALEYIWEPGLFNIYVGTNSRDVKSAQVTWNK